MLSKYQQFSIKKWNRKKNDCYWKELLIDKNSILKSTVILIEIEIAYKI